MFTPVPVRVPVPFHSFVLRSHLQKLTGPVPVAACDAFTLVPERDRNATGTRPERDRNATGTCTVTPPSTPGFYSGSVFISEGDSVDGFTSSTETVSYRWTDTPMHDVP